MMSLDPRNPTPTQLVVFSVYARTFSRKRTANALGLAESTVKNHMSELYARLGVESAMEAAAALGWISVPGDGPAPICGWVGYCSRPSDHAGHHGGFRSYVKAVPS